MRRRGTGGKNTGTCKDERTHFGVSRGQNNRGTSLFGLLLCFRNPFNYFKLRLVFLDMSLLSCRVLWMLVTRCPLSGRNIHCCRISLFFSLFSNNTSSSNSACYTSVLLLVRIIMSQLTCINITGQLKTHQRCDQE